MHIISYNCPINCPQNHIMPSLRIGHYMVFQAIYTDNYMKFRALSTTYFGVFTHTCFIDFYYVGL